MIFVRLQGGLGNQLFQYALGRALSVKCGCMVKFDRSALTHPGRQYALGAFRIEQQFATACDVLSAFPTVTESGLQFHPEVLANTHNRALLDGYWQSEKYFEEIGDRIREELRLRNPLGANAAVIANDIFHSGPASVALHVRRYDMARGDCRCPSGEWATPLMDAEYYHRAADYVASRLPLVHFFVFSDDLRWCRENLRLPYPGTFVDAPVPHEALRLMSLCKAGIMPPSSFSWWANWLPSDPHRIVVCPKVWFTPGTGHENPDLVPARWVQI